MNYTNNFFNWTLLLNLILLFLACFIAVSQLVKGSFQGFACFGMIAYVIVKLIKLER